jgi:uncharacterized protein YbaP (TraB family)
MNSDRLFGAQSKLELKSLLLLLSLVSLLGIMPTISADSSVWKITSGENTVYLGGTVHLLRPSDYPLPEEYEQAYQESAVLVFETDISSMNDLSIQAETLKQLTYTDGQSLDTVLNDEAYNALSEYIATIGIPMAMIEQFKPGMIISMLQLLEFQKIGFTPQGVDAYFNIRAMSDAKTLEELESVEEQIGFLAAMGEGNENEFILLSLSDLDEIAEVMEDMIFAWRTGDNEKLSEMFVADMLNEAPELYESLLRGRNLNWIPQIDKMLADEDVEFVLVGAAHLVGNDGLLELLKARGYKVSQL